MYLALDKKATFLKDLIAINQNLQHNCPINYIFFDLYINEKGYNFLNFYNNSTQYYLENEKKNMQVLN